MAEKIRVTVVVEYEPNLDHYPGCSTVAEASAYDERENPFFSFPDAYLTDEDTKSITFEAVSE
ncbi:hypothetical protein [Streptomyces ardesiacus]|uniref:hypothetical protein n=1 Tax=Streptomyces ardesiacus TaxID=285564 RepID=UPI003825CB1B